MIGTDNSVRKQVELELTHAMAVAEKANLAKSDFLSSMSHELRTPLNAILGFAQLLESGSPSPAVPQKRSVDQILKAGWYLLDLINEILDLSLIESGKMTLSLEPSSLAEVLRECQFMIEPQAQKRDIRMIFPQLEIPYFVKAERTRVKQVLINLLSNAVKYNQVSGTVVIDCTAGTPGRIRISVNDTGHGFRSGAGNARHPGRPLVGERSDEGTTGWNAAERAVLQAKIANRQPSTFPSTSSSTSFEKAAGCTGGFSFFAR